ncbi:MAG: methionine--tRNA ligase [Gemmatimonadales bacterium]
MSDTFYLTTAIDYANGEPHLGHAFEKIGADCIARYRRLRGDTVHFLIGMDEHGQTVAQKAAERGLTPQQQVDDIAPRFAAMWARLGISHDQFMRTASPAHHAGVTALLNRIFDKNPDDFYEHEYEGWYCVGCEAFKQPAEITDGRCTLHATRELQHTLERNWFFRLSKYRDRVLAHHERYPTFLAPDTRRNEIMALLNQGLEDISASRSRFTWGVPFPRPLSTGEQQTTYVWFDALPNYLTATGFPAAGYERRWPAQLHIVGKDITRFHSVIWPAMLLAAELPLPAQVWGHGFVLFKGEKFSKSAGVRLDLDDAVTRHGPDAFRYFLLREIPWDADGGFSWDRFDARYRAELADGWGNLQSRVLAMIVRYLDGVVPAANPASDLYQMGDQVLAAYRDAMDHLLLHEGAAQVWRLVDRANLYVEERQPWTQAKRGDRNALQETLGTLAAALARIAALLFPFMPVKATEAWQALALDPAQLPRGWSLATEPTTVGKTVSRPAPLFPKLDPDITKQ